MSFEELVKKLAPKLKAIAAKLDGRYASFDDEDLYQEALLNLWQKFESRKLDAKTDSYILQGCFFFLKNYIRKTYTRLDGRCISLEKTINESDVTLEDVVAFDYAGQSGMRDADLLQRDIDSILSAKEKEIFSLYLDEVSTREIGRKFNISHVAVVKTLKKIRDKCIILKEEIL
jgi:RNA polymerase sigma factor (sigma-70 family)